MKVRIIFIRYTKMYYFGEYYISIVFNKLNKCGIEEYYIHNIDNILKTLKSIFNDGKNWIMNRIKNKHTTNLHPCLNSYDLLDYQYFKSIYILKNITRNIIIKKLL